MACRVCVFKFAGCGLIGTSTTLDIASVQEIHTDRLAVGMETASIHLVLRDQHAVVFETLASLIVSGWSTHIVDLQVINLDCRDETLYLATIVNQVLGALLCLQSFHFVGGYFLSPGQSIDYGQGQIVLGHGYSGQLKNLKLQHLHHHTLDLGAATWLTSVSLSDADPLCMSCQLILPCSVVRLEVFGNSLTIRHAKCVLEGLSSLTHFTLGTHESDFIKETDKAAVDRRMPALAHEGSCTVVRGIALHLKGISKKLIRECSPV